MATSDFLPFGISGAAPVLSQAAYAGTIPANGRGPGLLPKEYYNKVARQSSVMAAAIGAYMVAQGQDALDNGDVPALTAAFAAAVGGAAGAATPIGCVMMWLHLAPPAGWLELNGAAISRATYATLFALWGTYYGIGNGTTTFNLPDARGEFPRFWDNGRGVDTGRTIGSAQGDLIKAHTHTVKATPNGAGTGGSGPFVEGNTLVNSGSTGGAENRPRNFSFMAIVKAL